jgi:hypothetical protein
MVVLLSIDFDDEEQPRASSPHYADQNQTDTAVHQQPRDQSRHNPGLGIMALMPNSA